MIKVVFPYQFILAGITDQELSAGEVASVLTDWIPALCSSVGPLSFDEALALGSFVVDMRTALLSGEWHFESVHVEVVRSIVSRARIDAKHAQAAYLVNKMLESDARKGQ